MRTLRAVTLSLCVSTITTTGLFDNLEAEESCSLVGACRSKFGMSALQTETGFIRRQSLRNVHFADRSRTADTSKARQLGQMHGRESPRFGGPSDEVEQSGSSGPRSGPTSASEQESEAVDEPNPPGGMTGPHLSSGPAFGGDAAGDSSDIPSDLARSSGPHFHNGPSASMSKALAAEGERSGAELGTDNDLPEGTNSSSSSGPSDDENRSTAGAQTPGNNSSVEENPRETWLKEQMRIQLKRIADAHAKDSSTTSDGPLEDTDMIVQSSTTVPAAYETAPSLIPSTMSPMNSSAPTTVSRAAATTTIRMSAAPSSTSAVQPAFTTTLVSIVSPMRSTSRWSSAPSQRAWTTTTSAGSTRMASVQRGRNNPMPSRTPTRTTTSTTVGASQPTTNAPVRERVAFIGRCPPYAEKVFKYNKWHPCASGSETDAVVGDVCDAAGCVAFHDMWYCVTEVGDTWGWCRNRG